MNEQKPTQPPLPAHLVWNEHTVPDWPKPAAGVSGKCHQGNAPHTPMDSEPTK